MFGVGKLCMMGVVTYLAGPHHTGSELGYRDGKGAQVQFGVLQGIATENRLKFSYFVDSWLCNVRQLNLATLEVTTLVGPKNVALDGSQCAFSIDGTAAFASRELRVPPQSFQLPHRTAEPGYSSVALDRSAWNRKGSGHPKGEAWAKGQRFRRPPGPGSNLPESKPPPGPGSYQKLHSWPTSGYTGTAKGFNHKGR